MKITEAINFFTIPSTKSCAPLYYSATVPPPLNRSSKTLYEIESTQKDEDKETILNLLRTSVQRRRPPEFKILKKRVCKPYINVTS